MSVKIEHVKLKIGNKIIELSMDDLKELKKILDETFPGETVVFLPGIPVYVEKTYPVYIPPLEWPPRRWYETWSSTSNTLTLEKREV